jgi:hypothetical protein
VHDPLFARALALDDGKTSVMLISCDVIGMADADVVTIKKAVADQVPVAETDILLFSTHTHTGPALLEAFETTRAEDYAVELPRRIVRAAETAWHDLAEASVSYAQKEVPGVAFERRYRMNDGSVMTNPGKINPDIVEPCRQITTLLTLIGFERDPTRLPIVVASFPCHADVVGGTEVSADYPGRLCDHLTHELPGHPETLFLRSPAGDINHLDVKSADAQGGYDYAKQMAKAITARALVAWGERETLPGDLSLAVTQVPLERRTIEQGELAAARSVFAQHQYESQLPAEALWARELMLLAQMPETLPITIAGLRVAGVLLLAVQGELFSELGEAIEGHSLAPKTLVLDCFSGRLGYLPPRESYAQNGYEERPARSSPYRAGSGEAAVAAVVELAKTMA